MVFAWNVRLTYSVIVAIFALLHLITFSIWIWASGRYSTKLQLFKFIGLAIGIKTLHYCIYAIYTFIEEAKYTKLYFSVAILANFVFTLGTALTFIAIVHMCVFKAKIGRTFNYKVVCSS
jgi:hypothetical protein